MPLILSIIYIDVLNNTDIKLAQKFCMNVVPKEDLKKPTLSFHKQNFAYPKSIMLHTVLKECP